MKTLLVVAVFVAGVGWLLLQNPTRKPKTALHEHPREQLGNSSTAASASNTLKTDPHTPPRLTKLEPGPPPTLGERAADETLRAEALPRDSRITSVRRVERWTVYATRKDPGAGPRLNPIVGQSAVIVDRQTIFAAHSLHARRGVLWIVELAKPGAPVAHAGDTPAPLVAAGADPHACVLRRYRGRFVVYAASNKTDTIKLRFDSQDVERAATAPRQAWTAAGTFASAPKPASVRVAQPGATFLSALPDDMPASIRVLETPTLRQALTSVDIEGVAVPIFVAFDSHTQVAGRLELSESLAPPSGVGAHVEITSLVPGKVLPALGATGLVHSVPGVSP